jgi:hypothetical protein
LELEESEAIAAALIWALSLPTKKEADVSSTGTYAVRCSWLFSTTAFRTPPPCFSSISTTA